jgi:hypothetical protein
LRGWARCRTRYCWHRRLRAPCWAARGRMGQTAQTRRVGRRSSGFHPTRARGSCARLTPIREGGAAICRRRVGAEGRTPKRYCGRSWGLQGSGRRLGPRRHSLLAHVGNVGRAGDPGGGDRSRDTTPVPRYAEGHPGLRLSEPGFLGAPALRTEARGAHEAKRDEGPMRRVASTLQSSIVAGGRVKLTNSSGPPPRSAKGPDGRVWASAKRSPRRSSGLVSFPILRGR